MFLKSKSCFLVGLATIISMFVNITYAGGISSVIQQDDDLRTLERQRQDALKESLQESPDQLKSPDSINVLDPVYGEVPCFNINNINISGDDVSKFKWLLHDLGKFKNQCLGLKSIEALKTNLNNLLIQHGYATTRVTLPNQKLDQNELEFQLHIGRVANIRIEDTEKLDWFTLPWATWRNAVPIAEGDILNIKDLDQGLEQLQRLPSQDVGILIEPDELENNSVLIIKRQQGRRVRGYVSVDNSGTSEIGREQAQVAITVDSPLGLNDQLSLSASSNIENATPSKRNQSASIFYSIPFGYHTFTTSYGYSRFGQTIQGTTVKFLSSGYSQNASAKWHTTLMRDASSKFGIYGSVSTRRARSFIEDVELLVQQRRTAAAEIGFTYAKKWQTANLKLETGYSKGMSWFQAEPTYLDSSADNQPTTRPNIFQGYIDLNKAIPYWGNLFDYNAQFNWQTTPKQTLSIDKFSIGSRYSVRGFDGDIILQSESGFSLRNELRIKGFSLADNQLYLAPYVALDIGHLWGPSVKGSPYTSLAGAAIGLRGQTKYFYADIALGTPLYKPDGFDTRKINPMLQLTLNI
jgi:hemolysin activation/secretion protein